MGKDKFRSDYIRQMYELTSKTGAAVEDIAKIWNVDAATVYAWLRDKPDMHKAYKTGRDYFDTYTVEKACLSRALGYTYVEKETTTKMVRVPDKSGKYKFKQVPGKIVTLKEKQIAPDPACIFFWLQNRQPERWRNTKFLQIQGNMKFSDKRRMKIDRLKTLPVEDLENLANTLATLEFQPNGDMSEEAVQAMEQKSNETLH